MTGHDFPIKALMVNCKHECFSYTRLLLLFCVDALSLPHITMYATDCMLWILGDSDHWHLVASEDWGHSPQRLPTTICWWRKMLPVFLFTVFIFVVCSFLFSHVFHTVFLIFLSKPEDQCFSALVSEAPFYQGRFIPHQSWVLNYKLDISILHYPRLREYYRRGLKGL